MIPSRERRFVTKGLIRYACENIIFYYFHLCVLSYEVHHVNFGTFFFKVRMQAHVNAFFSLNRLSYYLCLSNVFHAIFYFFIVFFEAKWLTCNSLFSCVLMKFLFLVKNMIKTKTHFTMNFAVVFFLLMIKFHNKTSHMVHERDSLTEHPQW